MQCASEEVFIERAVDDHVITSRVPGMFIVDRIEVRLDSDPFCIGTMMNMYHQCINRHKSSSRNTRMSTVCSS